MNKILFDLSVCQPIRDSKYHGGGIYGYILFKKLVQLYPSCIVAYYNQRRFIDPFILQLIRKEGIEVAYSETNSIIDAYYHYRCNLVYSPLYGKQHDVVVRMNIPFFVTIHGIRPIEMLTDNDEYNYETTLKHKIKTLIKHSPLGKIIWHRYYNHYKDIIDNDSVHIITVSNHSKYSIKTYFPNANIEKMRVYYSPSTALDNYQQYVNHQNERYFLIISANRWVKNAGRAIMAIDKLLDNSPNICDRVKVLGLKKNTNVFKRIKHKEKFEMLGYQTSENLEYLYAGAFALVYPTLNEGFGYPPLEAMKYGTPVIASPFTSVTEICGDAVLYANPYSVEEIANRILQLVEDDSLRKALSQKGVQRYKIIEEKQKRDLVNLCCYLVDYSLPANI